jgi:hypothetical protein
MHVLKTLTFGGDGSALRKSGAVKTALLTEETAK